MYCRVTTRPPTQEMWYMEMYCRVTTHPLSEMRESFFLKKNSELSSGRQKVRNPGPVYRFRPPAGWFSVERRHGAEQAMMAPHADDAAILLALLELPERVERVG